MRRLNEIVLPLWMFPPSIALVVWLGFVLGRQHGHLDIMQLQQDEVATVPFVFRHTTPREELVDKDEWARHAAVYLSSQHSATTRALWMSAVRHEKLNGILENGVLERASKLAANRRDELQESIYRHLLKIKKPEAVYLYDFTLHHGGPPSGEDFRRDGMQYKDVTIQELQDVKAAVDMSQIEFGTQVLQEANKPPSKEIP